MMGHTFPIQVASYVFSITIIFHILAIVSAEDSNPDYKRVCYYTNWSQYRRDQGKFMPADIDPFLCTHLIFAFAKIDKGVLAPYEWNDLKYPFLYKQFNSLKLKNPALKTLLAVGGWTHGSLPFTDMVQTAATRKKFIEHAMRYLRTHNFDGLDLDWEYPANRGSPAHDKQRFVELVKELREAFDKEAKKTGKEKLMLTMAVAGGDRIAKSAYEVKTLNKYVDFFNLMSYDLHGSWSSIIGHHAPLFGGEKWFDSEFDNSNVEKSVNMWLDMGAEPQKLVLGLALYGKTFKLCPKGNAPGDKSCGAGNPDTIHYYEILRRLKDGRLEKRWLDRELVPYAFGQRERIWVGYDDEESLKAKVNFAKQMKLGGVMAWSIDSDDFTGRFGNGVKYPLLNMVKDTLEGKATKIIPMPEIKPKKNDLKKEEKDVNSKDGLNKNFIPFTKDQKEFFKRPLAVPLRSKVVRRKQSKPATAAQVTSPFANKNVQQPLTGQNKITNLLRTDQPPQSNRFLSGSTHLTRPRTQGTGGASTRRRGLPKRMQSMRQHQLTPLPQVPDVQPLRSPTLRRSSQQRQESAETSGSPFSREDYTFAGGKDVDQRTLSKDDYLASHIRKTERNRGGSLAFSRGKPKRPSSEPFRALTEFDREKMRMEHDRKQKHPGTIEGITGSTKDVSKGKHDVQILTKENVKRVHQEVDKPRKIQYGTGRRQGQLRFRASSVRPHFTTRPEQQVNFQRSNKKRSWFHPKGSQETTKTDNGQKKWTAKENKQVTVKSPFSPPRSRLHRQGVSNPPHLRPVPYSGITSTFFTKPESKRWFYTPGNKESSEEEMENFVSQSGNSESKFSDSKLEYSSKKDQVDGYRTTNPTQSSLNWLSPTAHGTDDEILETDSASDDETNLQSDPISSEGDEDVEVSSAENQGLSAEEIQEMALARNRNKIRFASRESNAMAGIRKFKRKNANPHQSSSPYAHLEIDSLKNRDKMRDISKYRNVGEYKDKYITTEIGNSQSVTQGRLENIQDQQKTTDSWWTPEPKLASSQNDKPHEGKESFKSISQSEKVSQKSQPSSHSQKPNVSTESLETIFHGSDGTTTSKSTTISHTSSSTPQKEHDSKTHTEDQDKNKSQTKDQEIKSTTEHPEHRKTSPQEVTTKSHFSKTQEQSKKTEATAKSTDKPWWVSEKAVASKKTQGTEPGQSLAERGYPNPSVKNDQGKTSTEQTNLKRKPIIKNGGSVKDISKDNDSNILRGQKPTDVSGLKDEGAKITSLEELENEISNIFFKKDAADLLEANDKSGESLEKDNNNNKIPRTSTMPVKNRVTPQMQAYHSRNIRYPFKPAQNHKRFHRYNDRHQHPKKPESNPVQEEPNLSEPASMDLNDESGKWDKIRELLKNSTVVSEIKSSLDQIHRSLATGENATEEILSLDNTDDHKQNSGHMTMSGNDNRQTPKVQSRQRVSTSHRTNRRLTTDLKAETQNPESDASKFQQPFGFSAQWWKNKEKSDNSDSEKQSGDPNRQKGDGEQQGQEPDVKTTQEAEKKTVETMSSSIQDVEKPAPRFVTTKKVGKISSAESHTGKYVPWWEVTGKPDNNKESNDKEDYENLDEDNLDESKDEEASNSIYPNAQTSDSPVKSVVDIERTPFKSEKSTSAINSAVSAEKKPVPFASGHNHRAVTTNTNKLSGKRTTTAKSNYKWYLNYNSQNAKNKDENDIKDKEEVEKPVARFSQKKSFSPFARYQKPMSGEIDSLDETSSEEIDEGNLKINNTSIPTESTHGGRSHKGQRKRWSFSVESKEDKIESEQPEVEEEISEVSEEVFDTEPDTKPGNEAFQAKESFEQFLNDPAIAAKSYLIQGQNGDFKKASQEVLIGTSLLFGKGKRTDEFSCPSTFGIYSDKNNCKMFFQCVWYVAFHHVCGPGTAWNHAERICDWPTKTDCILAADDRFL